MPVDGIAENIISWMQAMWSSHYSHNTLIEAARKYMQENTNIIKISRHQTANKRFSWSGLDIMKKAEWQGICLPSWPSNRWSWSKYGLSWFWCLCCCFGWIVHRHLNGGVVCRNNNGGVVLNDGAVIFTHSTICKSYSQGESHQKWEEYYSTCYFAHNFTPILLSFAIYI